MSLFQLNTTNLFYSCRAINCSVTVDFGNLETLTNEGIGTYYVLQEDLNGSGNIIAAFENAVVSINSGGEIVETIAGSLTDSGYYEGQRHLARFNQVQGIYQVNGTTVIVSDHGNSCLRKIERWTGQTSPYAGECETPSYVDGSLSEARFTKPVDLKPNGEVGKFVVVEFDGRLRTVDIENGLVDTLINLSGRYSGFTHFLYISPTEMYVTANYGIITIENDSGNWYSGGTVPGAIDANRTQSLYRDPQGIVSLTSNHLLLADKTNYKLRLISKSGSVTSICTGTFGADDGSVDTCTLSRPYSLLVSNDRLYVGETARISSLPFTGEGYKSSNLKTYMYACS